MEKKLEQLLNSLIEKGWKPFGRKKTLHITIYDCDLNVYFDWWFMNEDKKSFRELVSKESWLWQFCCENRITKKMEKNHRWIWINSWAKSAYQSYPVYTMEKCEYRIIESSLKDESELEDFLLSNIKVEWER